MNAGNASQSRTQPQWPTSPFPPLPTLSLFPPHSLPSTPARLTLGQSGHAAHVPTRDVRIEGLAGGANSAICSDVIKYFFEALHSAGVPAANVAVRGLGGSGTVAPQRCRGLQRRRVGDIHCIRGDATTVRVSKEKADRFCPLHLNSKKVHRIALVKRRQGEHSTGSVAQ